MEYEFYAALLNTKKGRWNGGLVWLAVYVLLFKCQINLKLVTTIWLAPQITVMLQLGPELVK
ncbi:hypothetical protein BCU98_00610 [Vibrio splendidus]|nr:hypothetical protein BCU98_00610 [Vibrio splendidus]